jgi:hypothetical protein
MTADEFKALLATRSDVDLLGPCLHDEDAPYLFEPQPAAWDGFRSIIEEALGVSARDIRIVGSARFGFSLKPGQNFRGFRDTSDVDVVIVNADLFDQLWISLLAAAYPRPPASERDLLPNLPSLIGRVCSSFAPDWGVLRTRLV